MDCHVFCSGQNELANFHLRAPSGEFADEHPGDIVGQRLDKAPRSRSRDADNSLGGRVVVHGASDIVVERGKLRQRREDGIYSETLGIGSLAI